MLQYIRRPSVYFTNALGFYTLEIVGAYKNATSCLLVGMIGTLACIWMGTRIMEER